MSVPGGEAVAPGPEPDAPRDAPGGPREGPWAFGLLLLLQPVLFFRPLFLETFFFRDLYLLFFGQRVAVADQLRRGLPPLWDPYHHGGQALLANLNNSALYPTNLLYLLLPPVPAFNLEIVGHLAFAGAAAYFCARALSLPPRAALAAGLVFELCGVTLSSANLVNRLFALPWLPLLAFAILRHGQSPRRRWFALAVAAGTLQVLAGFPELILVTWPTVTLLAHCADPEGGRPFARLRVVAGAGALSLGLSAVQLMPLVSLAALSSRGGGSSGSWATWSVNPGRLPELVFPGFLGSVTSLSEEPYWGRFIEDQGFPYLLSISFGVACAGLVLASAVGVGTGGLGRRLRLGLAGFALLCVVASLGRHLPGLPNAGSIPFPLFRYPVKLLAGAILPAALLAADGLVRLAGARRGPRTSLVAATPLLVTLAFAGWKWASPQCFHGTLFRAAPSPVASRGLDAVFLHAVLVAAAFGAAALARPGGPVRRTGPLVLLALDLVVAGRKVNVYAPRDLLTAEPPLARAVRAAAGEGKLYRDEPARVGRIEAPSDDVFWLAGQTLGSLGQYTAANFGIPVVFHPDYDHLALREVVALGEALRGRPWADRLAGLSAAGVTAVLTADPDAGSVLPVTARGAVPGGGELFLLRNPEALPSARFVPEAWAASSDVRQLEIVLGGRGARRLRPREAVVLTGIEQPRPPAPCPSSVRRLEAWPALSRYEVRNACDGFLVFPMPFDDGWSVRIDGSPATVLRANFAFQAVRLPSGLHEVRHRYVPAGLQAGLAISALTALLLVLVLLRQPGLSSEFPGPVRGHGR